MIHIRRLKQLSAKNRRMVLAICLFVFFLIVGQKYYQQNSVMTKYACIEDPITRNTTRLDNVIPLPIFFYKNYDARNNKFYNFLKRRSLDFTLSEIIRISTCVDNYRNDYRKGQEIWTGNKHEIRRTHHTYLVPGENIIIDVGGNVADDVQVFLDVYKPKYYVILNPLKSHHQRLQERFRNYTNVITYNVGLGSKYEKFIIKTADKIGNATCNMIVVNAIDFFIKLSIGNFQVDLITINCGGCEYDLLETLVSTDLIFQFKHIQFATHSESTNLYDPVKRYCQLQESLGKSHKLTYQYKFQWETWKLKYI